MTDAAPKPSGGSDLMFIFGVLLLFFLIWLAGGGPSRPLSFAGPYLGAITAPGTMAEAYGDPSRFSSINANVTLGGSIKNVSLSRSTVGAGHLTLSVSGAATGPISTAGWRLTSKKSGKSVALPEGASVPRAGSVNSLSAITLEPGDKAVIVAGRSPIGISFRENLCTGYLEERQDFKPALAQSCPTPYQELERYYPNASDTCAAYVRSIPYCASKGDAKRAGASCDAFVEKYLNYNGCVAAHEDDSAFASDTWRIYLGSGSDVWDEDGDTVTLLDASGKVIDSLSY